MSGAYAWEKLVEARMKKLRQKIEAMRDKAWSNATQVGASRDGIIHYGGERFAYDEVLKLLDDTAGSEPKQEKGRERRVVPSTSPNISSPIHQPAGQPSQPPQKQDEIVRALEEFGERSKELEELSKTCKYFEECKEFSIPPMYPKCNHPQNRFKVCCHPDDCPILNKKPSGAGK